MTKQFVDTIIYSRYALPISPMAIYENMALIIDDGRIKDLIPSEDVILRYHAAEDIFLDHHVVMPGLVNLHGHAAMSLLRGMADDYPLHDWLHDHIWPAESKHVNANFVKLGSTLAMAEMLRSGTTCYSDMYFYPEAAAESVDRVGMRAQIASTLLDFPTNEAKRPDDYIAIAERVVTRYKDHPRIYPAIGPHAPYTVSDESFSKVKNFAAAHDLNIQVHLHETQKEVDDSIASCGKRAVHRLDELGILGPKTQLVHMTALNQDDIERVASSKSSVIHCPRSNLKLASGFCRISELITNGVNVALGTDGAASNNGLDMFSELQYAAMLAKGISGDATSVPAACALEIATLGGAKALGLDGEIGSLEAGKFADVIAIDISGLEQAPLFNAISQLVYTQVGHLCTDAWVAGQHLMKGRELTTIDYEELIEQTQNFKNLASDS